MLRDESVRLKIAGSRLCLLGIEDTGYTGYNFPLLSSTHKFRSQWLHKTGVLGRLLGPIPESEPRILLVHNPDFVAMLPPGRIDLVLSGHTHGGQVRLPLLGTPDSAFLLREQACGWMDPREHRHHWIRQQRPWAVAHTSALELSPGSNPFLCAA